MGPISPDIKNNTTSVVTEENPSEKKRKLSVEENVITEKCNKKKRPRSNRKSSGGSMEELMYAEEIARLKKEKCSLLRDIKNLKRMLRELHEDTINNNVPN